MSYIWLVISSICSVMASVALKSASGVPARFDNGPLGWALALPYFVAIAAYAGGFAMYALALRRLDLSIAYPLMVAMSIAGVFIYGLTAGSESITPLRIAGGLLVATGVFLLTR